MNCGERMGCGVHDAVSIKNSTLKYLTAKLPNLHLSMAQRHYYGSTFMIDNNNFRVVFGFRLRLTQEVSEIYRWIIVLRSVGTVECSLGRPINFSYRQRLIPNLDLNSFDRNVEMTLFRNKPRDWWDDGKEKTKTNFQLSKLIQTIDWVRIISRISFKFESNNSYSKNK